MKKMIYTLILSFSLLIGSLPINVFASTEKVVTFEQYKKEMQELHSKHGVKLEIKNLGTKNFFTRTELDADLETAKTNLLKNDLYSNDDIEIIIPQDNGTISPTSAMPISYTNTEVVKVNGKYGFAHFKITLKATVDAQYDTFISVNSYSMSEYGAAINFVDWKPGTKSYSIKNNKKECHLTFTGTIITDYLNPTTNIYVEQENEKTVNVVFKAAS